MNTAEDVEFGDGGLQGSASKGSEYSDTSGKVWSVYFSEVDKQDKALAENWKGDTEGILIFTGLFAATVAAFIIESYKKLSSDSGEATVLLLNQVSQQLFALSNGTQIYLLPHHFILNRPFAQHLQRFASTSSGSSV
ncbi:hypothetical protein B0F90DRAFT_443311 [Multifurca ochricompacta]|uniref:DUF6535 domain-containing protein n=1 Tax=Multifurca ochricompacta TaxID=376703 RepID=A0AAD4QHD1_9AGAM|nr:hypothetical protein B0F90DRAFT_443311 [Multifurca ochricompacta]